MTEQNTKLFNLRQQLEAAVLQSIADNSYAQSPEHGAWLAARAVLPVVVEALGDAYEAARAAELGFHDWQEWEAAFEAVASFLEADEYDWDAEAERQEARAEEGRKKYACLLEELERNQPSIDEATAIFTSTEWHDIAETDAAIADEMDVSEFIDFYSWREEKDCD